MVSLGKLDLNSDWLTEKDDPNSNGAVRNLVLDHATSMIFQRNYLSRMIRYDTQAAYREIDSLASYVKDSGATTWSTLIARSAKCGDGQQ